MKRIGRVEAAEMCLEQPTTCFRMGNSGVTVDVERSAAGNVSVCLIIRTHGMPLVVCTFACTVQAMGGSAGERKACDRMETWSMLNIAQARLWLQAQFMRMTEGGARIIPVDLKKPTRKTKTRRGS